MFCSSGQPDGLRWLALIILAGSGLVTLPPVFQKIVGAIRKLKKSPTDGNEAKQAEQAKWLTWSTWFSGIVILSIGWIFADYPRGLSFGASRLYSGSQTFSRTTCDDFLGDRRRFCFASARRNWRSRIGDHSFVVTDRWNTAGRCLRDFDSRLLDDGRVGDIWYNRDSVSFRRFFQSRISTLTQSVSIIVPVLNEQESLIELIAEIDSVAKSNEWTYETLVVDDGSADQTWKTLELLSAQYPHLAAARLNRNLGKSIALQTGIDRARYDFVVTIDGDLQDVPSEIPRLLEKLDEGFDVVSGWKKDRQDSSGKRFVSHVFNATVSFLTRVSLHDHNCGLKAYRKQVFESIQLSHGLHRFIPYLAARNGPCG
ncbi:MAG: glycosyltransferase family 2 protein [Pirellulaceae bacterium]